jgi:hypothetical protein
MKISNLISVKDLGSEFSIENWPAWYVPGQEALQAMKETHQPLLISAYDVDGKLIAPGDYHLRLQCILAQIHFTPVHWSIHSKEEKLDCYITDIQHICILELTH